MLTDENVATIEREIAVLKQLPLRGLSPSDIERLIFCGEALLAEVKKLRAEATSPLRVSMHSAISDADRAVLMEALDKLGSDAGTVLSQCLAPIIVSFESDLVEFRAFLDSFEIDYHVENHHGPNGSPIDGAACSIGLGLQEFAFDAEGRFLGWTEFGDVAPMPSAIIHLRGGGE